MSNVVFDEILGKVRAGDVNSGGGSGGTSYIGGDRINIAGGTISFVNSADIVNVTGTSVTLQPDTAYKIYATSQAITLNANPPAAGKWAYEGHLEIFVAGTGYVVTGSNVVLANALEPDAVNNCTVRFHDGIAIIAVEDHVAGYIVVNGSTSGDGSLYYGISTSTNDYVAFDATLNGTTIPLAGAVAEGEKHVVGNGYTETTLTGAVNCGTSKFTVANLSLQNVVVNGGVMTLGDSYIPSGSTVVVSGGGLAVERCENNGVIQNVGSNAIPLQNGAHFYGGGTVELDKGRLTVEGTTAHISGLVLSGGSTGDFGAQIRVTSSGCVYVSGCTLTGASFYNRPGVVTAVSSGCADLQYCLISGNATTGGATGVPAWGVLTGGEIKLTGCTVTDNTVVTGLGIARVYGGGTATLTDCFYDVGQSIYNDNALTLSGTNVMRSIISGGTAGSVTLTSGSIVDLTGNTNTTPINHGGGVVIGSNVRIYPSAGSASAVEISGGTYTAITNGGVLTTLKSVANGEIIKSIDKSAVISGAFGVSNQNTVGGPKTCTFENLTIAGYFYSFKSDITFSSCAIGTLTGNAGSTNPVVPVYRFVGSNSLQGYLAPSVSDTVVSAVISSGAILDLTGNTNPTPITPGGGITFEQGGATVLYSSGAVSGSYMMDNVTLPAGAMLTNTAVVNLGGSNVNVSSGTIASASGVTFTGGNGGNSGGAFLIQNATTLNLSGATVTNCSATYGAAIYTNGGGTITLSNTTITNNTGYGAITLGTTPGITLNITSSVVAGNPASNDIRVLASHTINIEDSTVDIIYGSAGRINLAGNNTIASINGSSATVAISSGATLDLTGNMNATPIAPGGGIVFEQGGATVVCDSSWKDGASSCALSSTNIPTLTNDCRIALTDSSHRTISGGYLDGIAIKLESGVTTGVFAGIVTLTNCRLATMTVALNTGKLVLVGTNYMSAYGSVSGNAVTFSANSVLDVSAFQDTTIFSQIGTLIVEDNVNFRNGSTLIPITGGTYHTATIIKNGTITEA